LARALERASGVPLRWISELDDERRARAGSLHPATHLTSRLDDILFDPDVSAVAVAVEPAGHHAIGRLVLLANKHLLVEKPMAMSAAEAQELLSLAEERERVLTVGHLLLNHPAVERARELVAAGALGTRLYFESIRAVPGPPRHAGSAWWTLAPHDVSLALHLLGESPVTVVASSHGPTSGGHDTATSATIGFAGGAVARVHVARFAPCKQRRFSILGARHTVVFDELQIEQPLSVRASGLDDAAPGRPIPMDAADPLLLQCRQFLSCAARNAVDGGNALHALDVIRVLEAGEQSMRTHGAIVEISPLLPAKPTRKVA
jgi:predicted dehydrogenase